MQVIRENKTAEIVVKKSQFIANLFYVENVEEAENRLNEIKKKYYDAKHHTFAYIIGINNQIIKASDDGEPSGTAGRPMLDILKSKNLTNVIVIVTRYFGGVLLGTGGLVRAYSDALKLALDNIKLSEINRYKKVSLSLTYDEYGKIEKLINDLKSKSKNSLIEEMKEFAANVNIIYLIIENEYDAFIKNTINLLKKTIEIEDKDKIFYRY